MEESNSGGEEADQIMTDDDTATINLDAKDEKSESTTDIEDQNGLMDTFEASDDDETQSPKSSRSELFSLKSVDNASQTASSISKIFPDISDRDQSSKLEALEAAKKKNESLLNLQSEKISSLSKSNLERSKENDRLMSRIESLESQLQSSTVRERKLLREIDEFSEKELPSKLEKNKLLEQVESLKNEKENISEALDEKKSELAEKERLLAIKENEFESLKSKSDEREKFLRDQIEKNENYQRDLLQNSNDSSSRASLLEQNEIKMKSQFESRLKSQQDIIKVHEKKVKEQDDFIAKLKSDLSKAEEVEKSLENQIESHESDVQNAIESAKNEIGRVMDELKKKESELLEANETILSLTTSGNHSYSANVLSKSDMNMSSVISELVTLRSEKAKDRQEIKNLRTELNFVTQQEQRNTPMVEELKAEYDKLLVTLDQVHSKHDQLKKEHATLSHSSNVVEDHLKLEEDKNQSLAQQNEDLTKQIVCLVQKQNSFFPEKSNSSSAFNSLFEADDEASSGQQVISDHLVEFSNVQELVEKNKELLQTVRQLSKDLEENESSGSIEQQLVVLKTDLDEVQQIRNRQEEMIKSLSNQRDMYKSLMMSQSQEKKAPLMDVEDSSTSLEWKAKIDAIKKEYEEFKESVAISEERNVDLVNSLKSEVLDSCRKVARIEAESKFDKEKLTQMENKLDFELRENETLRQSEVKLQASIQSLEDLLKRKSEEVQNVQVREKKISLELQSLKVNVRLFENEVKQLTESNSDLKRQRQEQNDLLQNFQSIETTLKAEHSRTVKSLQNTNENLKQQLDDSDREVIRLQKDSEVDSVGFQRKIADLEVQTTELKDLKTMTENELNKCKQQIENLEKQELSLKDQLKQANQVAQQVRLLKVDHVRNELENQDILKEEFGKRNNVDAEELLQRIDELKKEVVSKTEAMETLQKIAESSENALNDFKKNYDSSKADLETKCAQLESESVANVAKIKELNQAKIDLEQKCQVLESELEDLNEKQSLLNQSLQNTKEIADSASSEREEMEAKLLSEQEHISELESQLENVSAKEKHLAEEKQALAIELEELQEISKKGIEQVENEKAALERETLRHKSDFLDTKRQCELLTEQIESVTERLRILQEQQVTEGLVDSSDQAHDPESELNRLRVLLQMTSKQKSSMELAVKQKEDERKRNEIELKKASRELETLRVQHQDLEEAQKDKILITLDEQAEFDAAVAENSILRDQKSQLSSKLKHIEALLREKEAALAECELKLTELKKKEQDHDVLIAEHTQKESTLQKQLEMFRSRHSALEKRFGAKVDADTHDKVVKQVAELTKQNGDLQEQKSKLESELEAAKKIPTGKMSESKELAALKVEREQAKIKAKLLRESALKYRENFRQINIEKKELQLEVDKLKKNQKDIIESDEAETAAPNQTEEVELDAKIDDINEPDDQPDEVETIEIDLSEAEKPETSEVGQKRSLPESTSKETTSSEPEVKKAKSVVRFAEQEVTDFKTTKPSSASTDPPTKILKKTEPETKADEAKLSRAAILRARILKQREELEQKRISEGDKSKPN